MVCVEITHREELSRNSVMEWWFSLRRLVSDDLPWRIATARMRPMEVLFTDSAFRHGYTKQDFYELLAGKYLKIRSQRGLDEVYELLGRNLSGAYLHVVYRVLPDRRLRVFHLNEMTDAQKRRYRRYRK
jgi:hypothetical protein